MSSFGVQYTLSALLILFSDFTSCGAATALRGHLVQRRSLAFSAVSSSGYLAPVSSRNQHSHLRMQLPQSSSSAVSRRRLISVAAVGVLGQSLGSRALAGTLVDAKEQELSEVSAKLAQLKDEMEDPMLFSQKMVLQTEISELTINEQYLDRLRPRLEAGETKLLQRLRLRTPDMQQSVAFWTAGLGMKLQSSQLVAGRNVSVVAFGQSSVFAEDGGAFSLVLEELPSGQELDEGYSLEFIQLALRQVRLSRVIANGGQVESAYGHFEIRTPEGVLLIVEIDSRRDPIQYLGLRVRDVGQSARFYKQGLAMDVSDAPKPSRNADATDVQYPVGSKVCSFGGVKNSTGLLLMPAGKERVRQGDELQLLALLTSTGEQDTQRLVQAGGKVVSRDAERKSVVVEDRDGYQIELVDWEQFERAIKK